MRHACALLALAWAGSAAALDLEAGGSHERLTNNNADWNTLYVEGAHTFEPRQTLYGAARAVERFDLRDSQFEAGYYHPFTSKLVGQLEANGSPEHNFLARTSLFGALAAQFGDGWVGSAGYRHNEYTTSSTRILSAGLERYFSSFRAFYTMNNGRPEGAGSATAHRIGIDHYYADEKSRVGVSITRGREVENIVPNGIITSAVRAFNIYGRHGFSPDWALTWEVGTHEQGDFYRRTGARLGLRRHF